MNYAMDYGIPGVEERRRAVEQAERSRKARELGLSEAEIADMERAEALIRENLPDGTRSDCCG
jgi:hypothetical protein